MALSLLKGQIVPLIEKFEPELESILLKTLQSVKTSNPTEAELFYKNWKKLNTAIESQFGAPAQPPPVMKGGDESTTPAVSEATTTSIPEPPPPVVESTAPTAPVVPEASGPSFLQESGPSGPSMINQISEAVSGIFSSGPTGPITAGERKLFAPNGGSYKGGKRKHGKTAKQHRKRTHRVKHKKH